jgi:CRISPR-associated protein Cas2
MTVIVANDTPDAVRGMLKRWFIEPRPNVFVGTLNRRTHEKTIEYIKRHAGETGLLIINSYPNCQGYTIEGTGPTNRKGVEVSGLWMVAEKWEEEEAPGLMIIDPREFFSGNPS